MLATNTNGFINEGKGDALKQNIFKSLTVLVDPFPPSPAIISCNGSEITKLNQQYDFVNNTKVTCKAEPKEGYKFLFWSYPGSHFSNRSVNFIMLKDMVVTAHFRPPADNYNILVRIYENLYYQFIVLGTISAVIPPAIGLGLLAIYVLRKKRFVNKSLILYDKYYSRISKIKDEYFEGLEDCSKKITDVKKMTSNNSTLDSEIKKLASEVKNQKEIVRQLEGNPNSSIESYQKFKSEFETTGLKLDELKQKNEQQYKDGKSELESIKNKYHEEKKVIHGRLNELEEEINLDYKKLRLPLVLFEVLSYNIIHFKRSLEG